MKITVKEFIERLKQYPEDALVKCYDDIGFADDPTTEYRGDTVYISTDGCLDD